ncbi:hypothetical protein TSTA_084370 [Talaromyces stipitatus ATCC 10500]|uniref:Uncharacterized protein n=1 Tax=Talaromyces stipitatus (strain ATCC 10500 / CBS 375.48 / QM 6759 / NRRL 1006) TaxID=441959 RepID=B8M0A9_TALSN|nr:uncharacterized protein TSTA_084370 [Talaromyces stipitatus ATCC 10500]EED21206.1 hypothetical protein TSTA_084370 [Talaromyces stipitatus ATCC 10500]
MSTTGNRNKSTERFKCRKILSDHLKPLNVRTIPDPTDEYVWKWKEGKAHLLKTPLSKLSTKAFLELSNAVKSGSVWAIKRDRDSTTEEVMTELDEIKAREKRLHIKNACLQKTIQRHTRRQEKYKRVLATSEERLREMLFHLQEAQRSFDSLDPPVFSFE